MSIPSISKPELLAFESVPAVQVEIPVTTRERYITGLFALNLHDPDGTTGDWHDVYHWQEGSRPRSVLLGGSDAVDTNTIYGDLGVYEARSHLLDKGLALPVGMGEVYAADHYRAILDLLYRSLTTYGRPLNLTGATTSWLDTPEQQEFVLTQATRMADALDDAAQQQLVAWIVRERQEAT